MPFALQRAIATLPVLPTSGVVKTTDTAGTLDVSTFPAETTSYLDGFGNWTRPTPVHVVNTVTDAGANETLPAVTTATIHDLTLTEHCAVTLPAGVEGADFLVLVRQGGTGSYVPLFSPTPKWVGGNIPSWSTAVGRIDVLRFLYVAAWVGLVVGLGVQDEVH